MGRKLISTGFRMEEIAKYSRAVVQGEWVFVAGTTGFDYAAGTISDDVADQTEQTFRNIATALKEADASMDDTVRCNVFLAQGEDMEIVGPIMGRWMNTARPASTAVVTGFVDPRILVEVEITVLRQS